MQHQGCFAAQAPESVERFLLSRCGPAFQADHALNLFAVKQRGGRLPLGIAGGLPRLEYLGDQGLSPLLGQVGKVSTWA